MPADHVQDAGEAPSSGALALVSSRTDARVSGESPSELVSAAVLASPPVFAGPFTTSSGERVLLRRQQGQCAQGDLVHASTSPSLIAPEARASQAQQRREGEERLVAEALTRLAEEELAKECIGLAKEREVIDEQSRLMEEEKVADERAELVKEELEKRGKQALLSQTTLSTQAFGAREWSQYFGDVGAEPPLPSDISTTLSSVCPFWPDRAVKDTHLLVLIPSKVSGKRYNLNLLGKLIKRPKGGGHATKYSYYGSDTRKQFGAQSPTRSYWVLMTRDVLEGSRGRTYTAQKSLVAGHTSRTGFPYELPGALEAATAILSHYVRSGERLYTDDPLTWTRCQELEDNKYPVAVGGFSSVGLVAFNDYSYFADYDNRGVAGLRKF